MASALTYEQFLEGVNALPDQVISHELIMRDIEPQGGPVHNKRRQLARTLFEEYSTNVPPKIPIDKVSLDLMKMAQFIFAANKDMSSTDTGIKVKASLTLQYIRDKLNQMIFTNDFENDNKNALLSTIKSIFTPNVHTPPPSVATPPPNFTNSNVNNGHTENANDNITEQLNGMHLNTELPPFDQSTHTHTNKHNNTNASHGTNAISLDTIKKISKWNIKFTNDNKMSVFEFIDKVEAKANVYAISENDLFRVASEFFEGFPSKWYKSNAFNDWSHLKEMLVRDFVGLDYSDNLLRKIHEHKQTQSETVLQFFTDFEDDCSRLVNKLTDKEKIRILKLNVLQRYRTHIALVEFTTVNNIKNALQILENTMQQTKQDTQNRYTRFGSNDRSNSSQNFGQNFQSNGEQRSRYDKYRSNNNGVSFNAQNNRSFSNSSRNNSAQRQYQGTNQRTPTPHNRFNSQDRSNSKDRSQSRGNSSERYNRPNKENNNLKN